LTGRAPTHSRPYDPEALLPGTLREIVEACQPEPEDWEDPTRERQYDPEIAAAVRESLADLVPWMGWATPEYGEREAASWIEAQVGARELRTELPSW
jgi:hypothetical protein